jgi:hypothetical protein
MYYFCSLTWKYKLAITNLQIQCQTSYLHNIENTLVVLFLNSEKWESNGCLDRGRYLDYQKDATRRDRKWGM